MPINGTSRGGLLLSPPIGRESRLARRALRSLAFFLAQDGYISLRFDHFGTGDSSGSLEDEGLDEALIDGVEQGVSILRKLGNASVSAVGMRMGATIVGSAAATRDLGLSSFVMWDPCESGRAFVRETDALGAIRRDLTRVEGELSKMSEYSLSDDVAFKLNQFNLREDSPHPIAKRTLVVVRDDRTVSGRFRTRWETDGVDWATTSEQRNLLETEIPSSLQPRSTLALVRAWLTDIPAVPVSFSFSSGFAETVTTHELGPASVRETIVELGPEKMFGVVCEPFDEVRGPLIVFVNGINEDHVGPSRLWVELSRRWASTGLRCLRFDLRELGESPWVPISESRPVFDKTRSQDMDDALRAINPQNSGDSVLIGLCSGAQLALDTALVHRSQGVCVINPQVGAGFLQRADRLKKSDHESIRTFAQQSETLLRRHPWVGKMIRQISRLLFPSAYSPKVRSALARNHTDMLLLLSPEDLSPFPRMPILGSIDQRRLATSDFLRTEIVPGLDHDFLSTTGRDSAVRILDQYVLEKYVQ